MLIGIESIPFYRAVKQFEQKNYLNAAKTFLQCAMSGNIYAFYYVDYLNEKKVYEKNELDDSEKAYLKSDFYLYFNMFRVFAKNYGADAWLKTSLALEELELKNGKLNRNIINTIKSQAGYCGYAFATYNALKAKDKSIKDNLPRPVVVDLYYLLTNQEDLLTKHKQVIAVPYMKYEKIILEKFSILAINKTGEVERFISKFYDGATIPGIKEVYIDHKRKLKWQLSGALMGNNQLALMFSLNHVKKSKEANEWLMIAAMNGNVAAQLNLGNSYYFGSNLVEKDLLFAAKYYAKAIPDLDKFNDKQASSVICGQAFCNKGFLHEHGLGGYSVNKEYAFQLYLKATQYDNPAAFFIVGLFYGEGEYGVSKNEEKMLQYFKISHEKGFINATLKLADFYYSRDKKTSSGYYLDYLREKHTFENISSAVNYAVLQFEGIGNIVCDRKAAIAILCNASDKNDELGKYQLVELLLNSSYTPEDFMEFGTSFTQIEKYALSIAPNNPGIYCLLAFYYLKNNNLDQAYEQAYSLLTKGADKNDHNCLRRLGNYYEVGCPQLKIEPNDELAFDYYTRAAPQDDEALNSVGHFLMSGRGCTQNLEKAEDILTKLYDKGLPIVGYNLFKLYSVHLPGKNSEKLLEYLKTAEVLNDPDVYCQLGIFHYLEKTNIELAKNYFLRAAELGSRTAASNLCLIFLNEFIENGRLTHDNMENCFVWAKKGLIEDNVESLIIYGVIALLLDPTKKEEILNLWGSCPMSESEKYHKFLFCCRYLEDHLFFSPQEIFGLLKESINNEKDMQDYLKKINTIVCEQELAEMKIEGAPAFDPALSKIIKKIDSFIDPANRRAIDFRDFKNICSDIIRLEYADGFIKPSKKGQKVALKIDETKICFSFHEIHGRNNFDFNRIENLVSHMKIIKEELAEPLCARDSEKKLR